MEQTQVWLDRLRQFWEDRGSALIAFSGGVDSSVLLATAVRALGDRAVAVTARSELYPATELDTARRVAEQIGARQIVIETDELTHEDFVRNPLDRCYHCKRELFGRMKQIAEQEGLAVIAHGETVDDLTDFRPGHMAAEELGVVAPLVEVGLRKQQVRQLARSLGLEVWDKPSMACLASRLPYGERITPDKLHRVAEAEQFLRSLGFRQVRVRHHGPIARIEVEPEKVDLAATAQFAPKIVQRLQELGFTYVTLDLQGFRSGSMNEVELS